jgi:hypothetical protein
LRDREIRILALFTARVLFGQERANIETLAALRDAGCVVLCLVREEDWPEVVDIRRRLTQCGLDWIKTPQVDYPLRGWLVNWATRSPRALLGANRNFLRVVAAFRPTHIHAFSPVYVAGLAWALRKCPAPLVYRCGDAPVDGACVNPKTPSALCAALETYLVNPALARRHGAAVKNSLLRLGTGEYGRRWLEIYEST